MSQPTPNVTKEDVARVVRRDFSEEHFDEVMSALAEYGDRESYRVMLAALKMADGNLDELRRQIELAKCDYRDVIAPAEYPGYTKEWSRINKMSEIEKQWVVDQDWKEYETWLYRD
ncbi:MAG: hypothetical protein MUO88_01450 [Desulfobacterales bacterium]|nr:hypothetical protein [Desulfobacterales bacterium]